MQNYIRNIDKQTDEKGLENLLVKKVKELGGVTFKFESPGNKGVPDRIILYNGKSYFVEVKNESSNTELRKLQRFQIERIKMQGIYACRIKTKQELEDLLILIYGVKK